MRFTDLLRRELHIVLGARVTWLVAAVSALLIGHSFVLAVDLFAAASRSALGFTLMQREMDPLVGVVRPMLGGLQLAGALLMPVIAVRGLAIEKERRSYGALALAAGGTHSVIAAKAIAAVSASALLIAPVVVLGGTFVLFGGHLGLAETAIALLGYVLYLLAVSSAALAAAAVSHTVAQAATIAVGVSLATWAVDAGEGFAALAWLSRFDWLSIAKRLGSFEHGVIGVGAVAWFVVLALGALALAFAAAQIVSPRRRVASVTAIALTSTTLLWAVSHLHRAFDYSEQSRASLPPAAIEGLRAIDAPLRIALYLDRDDGRRAQLEHDALAKLELARPDLVIEAPLDQTEQPIEGAHDDGYGRIVIHAGEGIRETRSTSRKELVTSIFEAAGKPLPDWTQPPYPGYPVVIAGARRHVVIAIAYIGCPALALVCAWLATRFKRTS